jgi:homoisocitrate dehydrogenase
MTKICLIPGDGVGREVVPVAAEALRLLLPGAQFIHADAGWGCFERCGNALPPETLEAARSADGVLFGATQSPSVVVAGYLSPILTLRRELDLYANLRPTRSLLPGGQRIDLLMVRENTEGLYSGRERVQGDTAIAERVITRRASLRIATAAFEAARRRASRPDSDRRAQPVVTVVHKANVLKLTDGLFRSCCLEVATRYPDVIVDEMLVDAAAMWLVKVPSRFDVIVTTNLFGDILSDLVAGLAGGLGVAPSANVGSLGFALCEPVHGSAPDIAGRGIANPIGAMLSAALLLEWLGFADEAKRLDSAVRSSVVSGICTPDLGGDATTAQVAAAVWAELAASQ